MKNSLNKAIIIASKIHKGKKGRNREPAILHTGFNDKKCKAVDLLSRKKGEKYFNYIDRLKNSKLACKVKLADLTDNYIRRKQYKFASKIDMQKIKKYKKAYKILTGNSLKSAIKHF